MDLELIKNQICEVGHKLWQLGFVAANDGNITVKIDEDRFLATPTGTSKAILQPNMLIVVDRMGNVVSADAGYKPSSELPMHLICYQARPDIGCVIHAHPPTATGFAVSGIPLDDYSMPEAIIFLGSVPIAPYGTPSTKEVPDSVLPYLANHDAILLANHGALTVGADITTAYYRMETLEHFAKVSLVARQLGGAKELTDQQIEDCIAIRKKFNVGGKHPGYKKYSRK